MQPGYAQQPGFNTWGQNINSLRNQYGMNIPQKQQDNTDEDAKRNGRKYKFNEPQTNYIKYGNDGTSYIAVADTFAWSHKDNKQYWSSMNNIPGSYDGRTAHLNKVCFLDTHFEFNHVKPANYKLLINDLENK